MEIDRIYLGDCLELMRGLPDNSVDLIVTDPPYELQQHSGAGAFGRDGREYHAKIEHLQNGISDEMLYEMVRICVQPNLYLFCSKDQIPQILGFALNNKLTYDILAWHKTNPIPTCNNKYLSDTEYIIFMRRGANVYGTYETKKKWFLTPVNTADKDMYHHPTPKPVSIIQTLIENSSKEGDLVLDPFIGSATTAVAAIKAKRHFLGFEIDKGYYDIASRRIKTEQAQLSLF